MDIYETRRKNLHRLIEQYGGPTALSKKLAHGGTSYMSQLSTGRRTIGEKVARQIERQLRLPALWLDGREGSAPPVPMAIDVDALAAAIERVTKQLEKDNRKLSPAKHAQVVAYVYQEAAKGQTVDVAAVLKLVA